MCVVFFQLSGIFFIFLGAVVVVVLVEGVDCTLKIDDRKRNFLTLRTFVLVHLHLVIFTPSAIYLQCLS